MKYKLIVDKQSRTNPSTDKREYEIDVEELRVKGDVYDSLVITVEETYIMRRLSLSEYGILSVLDNPIKESLGDLDVQLFEEDNYIYLMDMTGNKFYAEYIIKNEFNNLYVTTVQMNSAINQTVSGIELSVSQTLTGYSTVEDTAKAKQEAIDNSNIDTNEKLKEYSTTEEMNSIITQKADAITAEVNKKVGEEELSTKIQQDCESVQIAWNKITEFIQFINAQLQIKDNNKNLLMALDKLGMHFYKSTGEELGDVGIQDTDVVSFAVMNDQGSMAWGIKYERDGATDFYPVFSFNGKMVTEDSSESSGYAFDGHFDFEAPVRLFEHPIYFSDENGTSMQADILGNLFLSAIASITMYDNQGLDAISINLENKTLNLFGLLQVGSNVSGGYSFDFTNNSIINVENVANTDTIEWLSSGDNYLYVSNKDGTSFFLWTDSSDKNLKRDIKNTESRALDKIKQIQHKEFSWKSNGKHQEIGYVAQEMQEIDPTFVHVAKIKTKGGEEKEDWQINTLSVLASATKAIQEQQEEIEELQEKDKQKNILIQSLIERIERLEGRNG